MEHLSDLYYFVKVVENNGFSSAAHAIGTQKSRLSRRIAALEDRLGIRLIQRSSRRFAVTEIGLEYYHRCVAVLVEAESAANFIAQHHDEPQGIVRVSCPTALLLFYFGEIFARFMIRYPKVELRLESTNRRVDLIAEGIDIGIRVRFPPLEETELVMRKLDDSTQMLVVRPDFLKTPLTHPDDLKSLPSMSWSATGQQHTEWRLFHNAQAPVTIAHKPRLRTDDMAVLRQAALEGVGIVQLPTMMIWKDIQAGTLVPVLPDWRPQAGIIHAVFPSRRGLLPSVRVLIDFLAEECASMRHNIENSIR